MSENFSNLIKMSYFSKLREEEIFSRIHDMKIYENLLERKFEVSTHNCGFLNVYVQGKIAAIQPNTPVFLTVHDLGTNHHEYHKLIKQPCMAQLKNRSVWIHVDLPGQENNSPDLPKHFEFPSLDKIAADLVDVLNYFKIKMVITLGEGAGANILLRFAMANSERVLGNVLIHCVTSVGSMSRYFQGRLMSWKLGSFGMNATTDQYLMYHKFGMYVDSRKDYVNYERPVHRYLERLHKRLNPRNLRSYLNAYIQRTDLTNLVRRRLIVDTMLVSGLCPRLQQQTDEMQMQIDHSFTTRANIPCYGSVMHDAPEIFSHNLLLFCQGLGLFSALPISRSNSVNSDNI